MTIPPRTHPCFADVTVLMSDEVVLSLQLRQPSLVVMSKEAKQLMEGDEELDQIYQKMVERMDVI